MNQLFAYMRHGALFPLQMEASQKECNTAQSSSSEGRRKGISSLSQDRSPPPRVLIPDFMQGRPSQPPVLGDG